MTEQKQTLILPPVLEAQERQNRAHSLETNVRTAFIDGEISYAQREKLTAEASQIRSEAERDREVAEYKTLDRPLPLRKKIGHWVSKQLFG